MSNCCDDAFDNIIPVEYKSIGADETFAINWGNWLDTGAGEVLTSSTWDVPEGITLSNDDFTDTKTTIKLSGGELGKTYRITNTIESSVFEIEQKSMDVTIIQK